MHHHIDIYCERQDFTLWAEPLNAITNAAFFVAAFFAYILARRENALDVCSMVLISLIACIGAGSSAFHIFATRATMLMDVLPILLFQMAFIVLYTSGVMRLLPVKTLALLAVFIACSILADKIPSHILNGSLSYAPAFLFLLGFGVWHRKHAATERNILLYAAGVFATSLTFRSVDMAVCEWLPIGTHFLWHILNGCVLYMATRGYIMGRVRIAPRSLP